jgi:predicted amino acid racemase
MSKFKPGDWVRYTDLPAFIYKIVNIKVIPYYGVNTESYCYEEFDPITLEFLQRDWFPIENDKFMTHLTEEEKAELL